MNTISTSTKKTICTTQNYPGLMDIETEYEVLSAKVRASWKGPKIPHEEWHKLLTFFRWTYNQFHGEAQARLYCNTKLGTWKVWPFPQEARCGMSAQEIDNDEAKQQRALFSDVDGWLYLGTVHHHCSAPAFQSGTDRMDEHNQDGLHITVGWMDKPKHDLHYRFVCAGNMFRPELQWFWDVDQFILDNTPPETHSIIAEYQMTRVIDVEFPELWKLNMKEAPKIVGGPVSSPSEIAVRKIDTASSTGSGSHTDKDSYFKNGITHTPYFKRIDEVIDNLCGHGGGYSPVALLIGIETGQMAFEMKVDVESECQRLDVQPTSLIGELKRRARKDTDTNDQLDSYEEQIRRAYGID